MTLEEYKMNVSDESDWVPGWDAIDEVFHRLYPDQKPAHYGTMLQNRAIFGGDQYLDGCSIYQSSNGYKHIVTYGMTELYANEKAFGGEWSGWGYEMTIKLKEESNEDCLWAVNMLSKLARYTYTQEKFFVPLQFVAGNGASIHEGVTSNITALLVVHDTEANGIDSAHGRVDFMQLVGITQREMEAIKADHTQSGTLIKRMEEENPFLVTDMKRVKSYL